MNIQTLDLNFQNTPESIASYLIWGSDEPVLVETGPGSTLPTLLENLSQQGLQPADIKHILVTHIHFDHAGSVGWWAQQGAQIYVHPFGAKHLIDPAKLIASATRIYGDKMDTLWGDILPAPAEKVTEIFDNDTVEVAGLSFQVLETPGHARHHHVYRLGDIAFTGDAAGIKIPGSPLVGLPAPPPEFEREVWQTTINRLRTLDVQTIYPTHFGPTPNTPTHWDELWQLMDDSAEFVKAWMDAGVPRDEIVTAFLDWNQERADAAGLSAASVQKYMMANPLEMSVDGIMRYWRKREEQ
ncbi:MAG: MBL fold metallo-hydrolase [Ardenticatenaceae bacterium]|nr:MBL fold metallo-hydrolase [Ardenticatenaceae bacterium]